MAVFVWLALIVVFLIAEAATVALVSAWFAVGALAAALVCLIGVRLIGQICVFLAVSALMFAALRPFVRKVLRPHITTTNVDSVPGSVGTVTVSIDNLRSCGQVKLGSMEWSARSTDGSPISAGLAVKVDRVEGVKVFVTPIHVNV